MSSSSEREMYASKCRGEARQNERASCQLFSANEIGISMLSSDPGQNKQRTRSHNDKVNYCTNKTSLFLLILLFIVNSVRAQQSQSIAPANADQQHAPPAPVQSASYVSLDGLTLVIIFDRPLNLSASIESVEQRHAAAVYESESRTLERRYKFKQPTLNATSGNQMRATRRKQQVKRKQEQLSSAASSPSSQSDFSFLSQRARQHQVQTCKLEQQEASQATQHLIGGVQLCAQLLTRKTLKLLHKHKLFTCLWASQVQFIIQLGKPIGGESGTAGRGARVAFRRGTLSGAGATSAWNPQEVSVELSKLPLEGLGVPLSPRLALTGPNQVPPCGQFSISAHLSSPYGTQPDDSVRLRWSVERRGMIPATIATNSSSASPTVAASQSQAPHISLSAAAASSSQQQEVLELQWQALREMVAQERSNHLVLDARLLQFVPQIYEFRLEASFSTSTSSFRLNASHQVGRLDFDTPIGTIYGSHLLSLDQQLNTNQDLGLVADVQVPECARNIKQVGLYWQVSDPRVRFEQTYAPFYLAKSGSLPEQALIEFRLNLFYGIRVKKFASAGTLVPTGESLLDAEISDGLLMASVGQPQDLIGGDSAGGGGGGGDSTSTGGGGGNLELFAISRDKSAREQQDKFTYQWSCFDGKTAQPCHKSLKLQASSGGTRYDVGTPSSKALLVRPQGDIAHSTSGGGGNSLADLGGQQPSPLLLVDRARQRQATLKLPLSWLDSDAQLWFGLQRFDRANPSQHSKTEYALVSVHPAQSMSLHQAQSQGSQQQQQPAVVSIGPVLIGRSRQRATIRNPLTGAIVLIASAPALIVGRLSAAASGDSFTWHSPNYPHPLHWTTRNVTNPLNGQEEILTELHLDQAMLVAHAHHQIQLSVCSSRAQGRGAATTATGSVSSTASVSLDVVQGVTQCRVELLNAANAGRQQALSLLSAAGKQQVSGGVATSSASALDQELPLVVTVNYCNIPLGLSPITYQLYIIDTSASDGFVATSGGGGGSENQSAPQEEDYMNEADVQFYEAQAQPLSVPQLSPVFSLGAMSALTLTGIAGQGRRPQATPEDSNAPPPPPSQASSSAARIRFAVRVCDRLPSCQMFYSNSIDPLALVAPASGNITQPQAAPLNQSLALGLATSAATASIGQTQRLRGVADEQSQAATVRSLHQMLDAAKRANTAGNSIAAISIANAVVQLGQRRLAALDDETPPSPTSSSAKKQQQQPPGTPLTSGVRYSNEIEDDAEVEKNRTITAATSNSNDEERELARAQLRELVQLAMRDCLHYGARSIQRHFHYTESGHTSLVLSAMGRIVASPLAGFELKFRSLRLVVMLVRKTLDLAGSSATSSAADAADQHVARLAGSSAPDFKAIQQVYESLYSTLAQYSPAKSAAVAHGGHQVAQQQEQLGSTNTNYERNDHGRRSANKTINSSGAASSGAHHDQAIEEALEVQATTTNHQQQASPLKAASRRNKEEAILAYLKLARTANKALLQSAASQLALGAVQSFEYQSAGGGPGNPALAAASNTHFPGISATPTSGNNNNNFVEAAKFLASEQPPAHIVSSLTHQTALIDNIIELDLREFGQVSLQYDAGMRPKLARLMRMARLRCRATSSTTGSSSNDTQSKCSSFVLALTSYAGKAPFRSLDSAAASGPGEVDRLRVPIVQVDWLSPLDGSSLVDHLRNEKSTADANSDLLTLADFRSSVTFTLPGPVTDAGEPYKCYKFDEQANEWTLVAGQITASVLSQDGSTAEQTKVLKCAYDGYGALGAFRGRPVSSVDTPMELSIAVGVGLILAVVSVFSILGCMASKAKGRERPDALRRRQADEICSSSGSSSAAASNSYDDEEEDGDTTRQVAMTAAELPHHLNQGMPRHR